MCILIEYMSSIGSAGRNGRGEREDESHTQAERQRNTRIEKGTL